MTYMAGGKQFVAIPTGLSLIGNRVVRQPDAGNSCPEPRLDADGVRLA